MPAAIIIALDGAEIEQVFVDGTYIPEARWPDASLAMILSRDSWAEADGRSYGTMVDLPSANRSLAATGVDWTGALMTLQGTFTTYTRYVRNHSAGSSTFNYDKNIAPYKWERGKPTTGVRYWLSGKLEALLAG